MKNFYNFYKFLLFLILLPAVITATNESSAIQLKHKNFQVSYSGTGVQFTPSANGIEWNWGLSSVSGMKNIAEGNVAPTAIGNDVKYFRGNITEQYLFRANSIEQQFVIENQDDLSGDLIIEGKISASGIFAKVNGGWAWVEGNSKVFLGDVFVYDASGKQIPASMEVTALSTKITVYAEALQNAAYPVTIDPQIGTSDFLLANNGNRLYQPGLIYNPTDQKFFSAWTNYDNTQTRKENIFGGSFDLQQIKTNPFTVDQLVNYPNFPISGAAPSGAATNSSATSPDVAFSGANYLTVWEDMQGPNYFDRTIKYRLSTNSTTNGNAIPVFNSSGYISSFVYPIYPAVAGNNSKFLITAATGENTTSYYVLGKYITSSGAAESLDSITLMSSATPFVDTDVDARPAGNFYVAASTINTLYFGIAPASGSLSPNSLATSGNIGSVAIAAGTDKALLVWSELSSGVYIINGMWIDNTGAASGGPFQIDTPALFGSGHPSTAYDPNEDSWLVVWDSNPLATPGTIISGREILANNTMNAVFNVGNQTRTSVSPTVAYDTQNQEFWIVWSGGGSKDQILGRRWVRFLNQTPSFTAGTNQTILEDAGAQTITAWATNISAGAPDETSQTLTFFVSTDNSSLFTVQPAIDATTGTLTYTPVANAYGTATVSVYLKDDGGTAHDAIDQSAVQTFTIAVTGINDAPAFTAGIAQTVLEDAGAQTVSGWATGISPGNSWETSQTLQFTVSNDNNALFSVQPVLDASGNLTFTSAANAFGTASVSVYLKDDGGTANGGVDQTATQTFTISVTSVNDIPSFLAGTDQTVLEDAGVQTVSGWATGINAGPANESAQMLTFMVTNDNNALFIVQPAIDASGNLTFTPAANAFGTASVSVYLKDDGGTANGGVDQTATQTFNIDITSVNDVPIFTSGSDQTVLEDAGAQTVSGWATAISAGPANESTQVLTFVLTNDNNVLFSSQPAIDVATGDLTYTPAANANGSAIVSVYLKDDGGTANGGVDQTATQTFTISVTSVNDVPTFLAGTDQTVLEDAGAQTVSGWATGISAGPANESAQMLTFMVTNDNTGLFTVQPVLDASGNLTYTPADDAFGTASVSVYLKDDGGTTNGGVDQTATQTFDITVNSVNDVPSFTAGTDQTVLEDAGAQTISGWATGISPGNSWKTSQTLQFTVTNDNNALFSVQPALDASGNLTYTSADNAFGSASVSVYLKDDGGTANGGVDQTATQTFTITVTSVNDVPTFLAGTDQTVLEDAGAQTVSGWATGISAGPANESTQVLNFVVTNDNNVLFSSQPAIDAATGDLTYTPAANANGSAIVSVYLKDDGGTANGGVDQTATQTFTITVTSVNDVPSFTAGTDQSVLEDAGAQDISGWATNISAGNSLENSQTLQFEVANDNTDLFSVQPAIDPLTGDLTFTSGENLFGIATVTVVLKDDGGTANGGVDSSPEITFTIEVSAVNDKPVAANTDILLFDNETHTFASTDFGFSDLNDTGDVMSAISVLAAPNKGTLLYAGNPVTLFPLVIAVGDIPNLVYQPVIYESGNPYTSFPYIVADDNLSNASNGVQWSDNQATLSIQVTQSNHAPTAENQEITMKENQAFSFGALTFGFADVDANNVLGGIKILTLPSKGQLYLNGALVTAGAVIPTSDLSSLSYSPPFWTYGSPFTSFLFQVMDSNPMVPGWVPLLSVNSYVFHINVERVNRKPYSEDHSVSISEDETYTFAATDFPFIDYTDQEDVLSGVVIVPTTSSEYLTYQGKVISGEKTVPADSLSLLKFKYASQASGNFSFNFRVIDNNSAEAANGVQTSAEAYTFSIEIIPVNDPPATADFSIQTNQDQTFDFSSELFPFVNPEEPTDELSAISFKMPVTGGSLLYFGKPLLSARTVPADSIGQVSFVPEAGLFGEHAGSVLFSVFDNNSTGASNGIAESEVHQISVNILHINHAPEVQNPVANMQVDEFSSFSFIPAANIFSDQDGDELTVQLEILSGNWLQKSSETEITGFAEPGSDEQAEIRIRATDPQGKSAETTFKVNILRKARPLIYGRISGSEPLPQSLLVVLLASNDEKIDSIAETATLEQGYYYFEGIGNGNYTVKAEVSNISEAPRVISTYYESTSDWTKATHIIINTDTNFRADIQMLLNPETSGNGKISGTVRITTASSPVEASTIHQGDLGTPLPFADIFLTPKGEENPLLITHTKTDGTYTFENIPDGEYIVSAQLPGFVSVNPYSLTIGNEQRTFENINFLAYIGDGIVTDIQELNKFDVTVYPNPTSGMINLRSNDADQTMFVKVIGMTGQLVMKKQFEPAASRQFDIGNLVPATYFIEVSQGNHSKTFPVLLMKNK
ncbi:MAG: T9SS type A sorting domain-containing protein [Prolixibacteraceae bacterium]|jgi:hypothetical protein